MRDTKRSQTQCVSPRGPPPLAGHTLPVDQKDRGREGESGGYNTHDRYLLLSLFSFSIFSSIFSHLFLYLCIIFLSFFLVTEGHFFLSQDTSLSLSLSRDLCDTSFFLRILLSLSLSLYLLPSPLSHTHTHTQTLSLPLPLSLS